MKFQVKIKKEMIEDSSDCDYSKLRVKREPSVEFDFYLPAIDETQNKKNYSANQHDELPLSHTKPLKCKVCSKSFKTNRSLKQHNNIFHLQLRDFECLICKKIFSSNHQLSIHQAKHITTKDHQCKFCEKTFASAFYASLHEKRFHGKFL